jgi:arsenate reductase
MLDKNIESLTSQFVQIPEERKKTLQRLADFIKQKEEDINLVFICTHNSRRSHISQIWAQAAATHYNIRNLKTYSGGTEATAFNPNAVAAMNAVGFKIDKLSNDPNPVYEVRYSGNEPSIKVFSKKYDDDSNPKKDFCAIMTCSDADAGCPVVTGAAARISLPFKDPKGSDGTAEETASYAECVNQIGREILYAFSLCK